MSNPVKTTPMMAQWYECKKEAGTALLFFRLGDFYEAFYDDAILIAGQLDLTLTKRQEIPMCGVPFHSAEGYIDKLIGKGYRVAIAEQVEDPREVKGLVKREIVRILSPGTILQGEQLQEKAHSYIACISKTSSTYGIAALDVTTSDFQVFETSDEELLLSELHRLGPSELLVCEKCAPSVFTLLRKQFPILLQEREEWRFDQKICHDFLLRHFSLHTLDGFGLKGKVAAVSAAGSLLCYLQDELHQSIAPITSLRLHDRSSSMQIDMATQLHLELLEKTRSEGTSLYELLDETKTPMGARLLRNWIVEPLLCPIAIQKRQESLFILLREVSVREGLQNALKGLRDLERLAMRIAHRCATPRDLLSLAISLAKTKEVKESLSSLPPSLLAEHREAIADFSPLAESLLSALIDTPPLRSSEGNLIREGYNEELDALRLRKTTGEQWLAEYQTKLREELGIKTLKVSFTKAFGYYIEVSRVQAEKMPASFHKRQTLVGAERFLSPQLKEFEEEILSAEEKALSLEEKLFQELLDRVTNKLEEIKKGAHAIAQIDVLLSLAIVAHKRDYVCPLVDESDIFQIEKGRHPVLEASLPPGEFICNDVHFDTHSRLWLITGPNMAGKSTFLRQVALLCLLAQIGSFVPASSAHIGIVDRLFSRIGASDDLATGKSTFMVEMSETAHILRSATSRSLIILDEIGRGTSTYDGIAIAWAVAEYLLTIPSKRAKTLFATHYSELSKLEEKIPGAANYTVSIEESGEKITFLHKIVRGSTDKSYGIHVARLAGLPAEALSIAKRELRSMEKRGPAPVQLPLFNLNPEEPPLVKKLRELDPNKLTPLEALSHLFALKEGLS